MIKKIKFNKFRKLVDIELDFQPGINAISGTNGTCKSSILYIISNSFQAPIQKDTPEYKNVIALNDTLNPKIESITKGDQINNDPSSGIEGEILNITYTNNQCLSFRRTKHTENARFRVLPSYKKDKKESLPKLPVVYLGISRLMPFGELSDDHIINDGKLHFTDDILVELNSEYRKLTHIDIKNEKIKHQSIEKIKKRDHFLSNVEGIDSNTISAGEDNIRIILKALFSLKQFYKATQLPSCFIIDEFDATLHPSLQIKIIDLMIRFSKEFKIQIFFSTHSLYLLEHLIKRKENVLYLINNVETVAVMPSPNMMKIEMNLMETLASTMYSDKNIPILTEDAEARLFIEILLDYFKIKKTEFSSVKGFFHLVKANFGCGQLDALFSDQYMSKTTMNVIAILDGDQETDVVSLLKKNMVCLPGGNNPEQVIFNYIQQKSSDTDFWDNYMLEREGFNKSYYNNKLKDSIDEINNLITKRDRLNVVRELLKSHPENFEELKQERTQLQNSYKDGEIRKKQKKLFNDYLGIMRIMINIWVEDPTNEHIIHTFYKQLHTVFRQVSSYNGIDDNIWQIPN